MNWSELPEEYRAAARRAAMPDYAAWEKKIKATGACSHPIRMTGGRTTIDAATGEVVDEFHTRDDPLGYLMVACGNRRESVCPACAQTYRADTFQLIRAGLIGGKGVPDEVSRHPAIFATVTAPSFGPVHTAHRETGRDGKSIRCRIRRSAEVCPHGTELACRARHEKTDRIVGQALCLDCYDYSGAVLFNAHAGELWRRLTIYLRRELAAAVGQSRAGFAQQAKVSFAKVAEYQARGVVHFHTIIRIDGPDGAATEPPGWATVDLLDACLRRAVQAVHVDVPDPHDPAAIRTLRFGRQVDIQPITESADVTQDGMTSKHVAAYIAKYVTKSAEATGTVDRRIRESDLDWLTLPPHAERMVRTCFDLARQPGYAELLLSKWAHMLGYRGHAATKSRAYSTTYGEIRGERKAYREAERRRRQGLPPPDDRPVMVQAQWTYLWAGLAYGEQPLVDGIRRRQQPTRDPDRDAGTGRADAA